VADFCGDVRMARRRRPMLETAFRISNAHAWRALSGWRSRARTTAGSNDRAAAGAAAREGFDRGRPRWHHASRCNNGKEVIQCLTSRWRVAQARRTRPWSRPPGSADAAGNINPIKPA
jgi:hypothetical protein